MLCLVLISAKALLLKAHHGNAVGSDSSGSTFDVRLVRALKGAPSSESFLTICATTRNAFGYLKALLSLLETLAKIPVFFRFTLVG